MLKFNKESTHLHYTAELHVITESRPALRHITLSDSTNSPDPAGHGHTEGIVHLLPGLHQADAAREIDP